MKVGFRLSIVFMFLVSSLLAQTEPVSKKVSKKTPPPSTKAELQALKDAVAAQQAQIQALTQQLQQTNQQLQQTNQQFQQAQQQLQQAAAEAQKKADAAQLQASQEQQSVGTLTGDIADLKTSVNKTALAFQEHEKQASENLPVLNKQMESTITIRFRGINITPGGYAEAAFIRRSRALGADLPTPFGSVPMPGSSLSRVSDFFGSGRQSKATMFASGKLGNVEISSYISADFLGAGTTSTNNQTNGYVLRLRQAWAQARFDNGWSFLGGQAWSLVTEVAKGVSIDDDMGKTNDVRPKTIDPSYSVGFDFARQYGIRLTKTFNDTVAIGFAVENPQATLTTHLNASNFLLGQPGDSKSYNTGSTYAFNPAPDLIAKIAFDPGFGHYEIFALTDRFTGRVYPCVENYASAQCGKLTGPSVALAYNHSHQGGGVGASARWKFAKQLTFGVKGFGGSGIGRYAPGGLSDASINADGTIHLIKNLHGLSTLEWQYKKLMVFSYGGVEYASRTYNFDPLANKGAGANVGYGAPTFANYGCYAETVPGSGGFAPGSLANCTADTRALIEGTLGFWYRFYSGPKGSFRYGTQYSYVTRNTWSGAGGLPAGSAGRQPNGVENMIFTSFRYYLP
jgi:hypothetical protein